MRTYHPILPVVALFAVVFGAGPADAEWLPEEVEFFESRIRPVLAQECYECHRTGGKTKGGLALDHRTALLAGGESGPAVKPGNPEGSLLIRALRHEIADLEMPKNGAKLGDEVIADFVRWIELGAPDPREVPSSEAEVAADTNWEAVRERRKNWWSFQPIEKPEVPPGEGHPVDRFLAGPLQEAGLVPADPADRVTLIRRLSFALRGLPPTPVEVDAFVADDAPRAYERLVDRYLAAPQFGERWARHWMDWIRYADSHGSEGDPMIPNAWRYRDYLIRALNRDVPYDQLVREHIAGDLLEKPRVAEGRNESMIGPAHFRMVFHGFAPTDALDEKVRFTDDQVNSLTKGFLGLTVACARCHDHKFDAISQKDYYALFGILASTKPGAVTIDAPGELARQRRGAMHALKREIRGQLGRAWEQAAEDLERRLAAPDERLREAISKAEGQADLLHPFRKMDSVDAVLAAWRRSLAELEEHRGRPYRYRWAAGEGTSGAGWVTRGPSADRVVKAGAFAVSTEGDEILGQLLPRGVYSHLFSSKDPGIALSPRVALDGRYDLWLRVAGEGDAMVRYAVQDYPRNGTVFPVARLKGGKWRWQRWNLDYWEGDEIHLEVTTGPEQAILSNTAERSWMAVREAVLVGKGEPGPPNEAVEFAAPILAALSAPPGSAADLAAGYARAARRAVEAWRAGRAGDAEVLFLQKLVEAGLLPNSLGELPALRPSVDRYRQLESEVVVPTRVPGVWEADSRDQPLFVRGDHRKPSETVPRRFLEAIDERPYRTSQSGRRELAEDFVRRDNPFTTRVIVNRLWHHLFGRGLVPTADNFGRLGQKPSHPELLDFLAARLVERGWSLKDSIRFLVLSNAWQRSSDPPDGARERDPGNRLLSHFRVNRLEAEAIRDNLLTVAGDLQDQMYGPPVTGGAPRRSVYLRVKRNSLDPFLAAFDAPVPHSTVGRRDVTNVPAQSLTMLNSDFVIGLAERWAERLPEGDPAVRVEAMFREALGRAPDAGEGEQALTFLARMSARRAAGTQARRSVEAELKECRIRVDELMTDARERVLAVRGAVEVKKPAGPRPLAHWEFEADGKDRLGELHLDLHGGAVVRDGALVVGAKGGFASSASLKKGLRAHTLEAWVQLDTLEQRGGGVMTIQTPDGDAFNAIVYAESEAQRWLAGSEFHRRTAPFGGPTEAEARDRPVHVAISWAEDGTITAFRDGQPYGTGYRKADAIRFAPGQSQVLFGCRHGAPAGNRLLAGRIFEARLYDRALSAEEVAASAGTTTDFIPEADLLAALSEEERRERVALLADQAALESQLGAMRKAGRPGNEWADLAHALFNLKEFIYVR